MNVYVFGKKSIIKAGICLFMLFLSTSIVLSTVTNISNASAQERKIPIYCVDRQDKTVSISFDAAWGNEQTQTLLDILEENDVKATFFLVGTWVDKYPESVKAIADAGHDIGSHSNKHDHMPTLSYDKIVEDTKTACEKIEAITGKAPTLYRPPYGDYDNNLVKAVNDCNLYCVQWDVDSLDWKDPTPEEMVKRIKSKISNGSIILMHNGAKNTPEALPLIIKAIKDEGYKIVPISQLLLKGKYATDHEGRMYLLENGDGVNTQTDKTDTSEKSNATDIETETTQDKEDTDVFSPETLTTDLRKEDNTQNDDYIYDESKEAFDNIAMDSDDAV